MLHQRPAGTSGNPFVRRPAQPETPVDEPIGVDEFFGAALSQSGPAWPAAPVQDRASSKVLPRREVTVPPTLAVAGVHGGAGATTLAALLGAEAMDVGVTWPVAGGWTRPLPVIPVVLVARTHGAGLRAAEEAARSWAAGELGESRLLGLVLVDDAPRLTRPQRAAAKRVSMMTPHGWHISWQPAWREPDWTPGDSAGLSARVRRTLTHIRRLADHGVPDRPLGRTDTPLNLRRTPS